jgi:tetratricopeptide (TPR) repeat protein
MALADLRRTKDPKGVGTADGAEYLTEDLARLAHLLNKTERAEQAEQVCQQAIVLWEKISPEKVQDGRDNQDNAVLAAALRSRATILAVQPQPHRDLEQALSLVRKAVELSPRQGWGVWNRVCLNYYGPRNWEGAETDARLAMKLTEGKVDNRIHVAPFLLLAGKAEEYGEFCRQVVEQLSDDSRPFERESAARLCVLHPEAAGIPDRVVRIAEGLAKAADPSPLTAAGGPGEPYRLARAERGEWAQLELAGIAHCRAGHYEQAVEWLKKARQCRPAADYYIAPSVVWLELAIAYHHLGREREAREQLDKARQLLDPGLTVGESTGAERMRLAVLRHEAESLILRRDQDHTSNVRSRSAAPGPAPPPPQRPNRTATTVSPKTQESVP